MGLVPSGKTRLGNKRDNRCRVLNRERAEDYQRSRPNSQIITGKGKNECNSLSKKEQGKRASRPHHEEKEDPEKGICTGVDKERECPQLGGS